MALSVKQYRIDSDPSLPITRDYFFDGAYIGSLLSPDGIPEPDSWHYPWEPSGVMRESIEISDHERYRDIMDWEVRISDYFGIPYV